MYTSFQLNISILSKMNWQGKKSIYKAEYFHNMEETYRKETRKYIKWENGLKIEVGCFYIMGSFCLGTLFYLHF
jgi:hypothetical protein